MNHFFLIFLNTNFYEQKEMFLKFVDMSLKKAET